MADFLVKSVERPDNVIEFPRIRARIVAIGDLTVAQVVSELTRALAGASGLPFEDRGTQTLKGLDGEWKLAAFAG